MTLFQEWRSTTPAYEPLSSQAPLLPTSHSSDKSPALYSLHSRRPSRSFLSNAKSVLSGCRLWVSLFQLAVVVLACFGISQFVEQKLGRLIRVHRLSDQELSQVGWSRPPLRTTFTSSPTEPAHSHARPLVHDFQSSSSSPQTIQDQHLLILTPCRNCATTLPRYFELVESLDHPKDKTSIGFLVSDDTDDTVDLMSDFITRHQDEYRQLTLLRKDFSLPSMLEGPARHSAYLQDQRRQIMAKARTFLVTSTLEPSVDWVLWLDSDVVEIPSTLFEDLLTYGNAGIGGPVTNDSEPVYDIITPNIFQRYASGYLNGYDRNNWAETSSSLWMKMHLADDEVLVEGNVLHPTGREHLSDAYVPSNYTFNPNFLPSEQDTIGEAVDRFDPTSDAFIGARMPLDAVGGVSTLVRATAHRVGAIFPAFVIDHQVETEGFSVLARALGARICGLPNYGILHRLPGVDP